MKKRIKIAFVFILLLLNVSAQNHFIDSLKLSLKNADNDSTRCKVLHELIESIDGDGWLIYNDELLVISETNLKNSSDNTPELLFYKKFYAEALANKGFWASEKYDAISALKYYNKSVVLHKQLNDKESIATDLNNLGLAYQRLGNIKLALQNYSASLKILEETGDKYGMAYCFNNLGFVYYGQGDFEKALDCYNKSHKMYKEISDKKGMAISLINIGAVHHDRGNYTLGLDNYAQGLKLYEELSDKQGMAHCLNNMATVNDEMNHPDEALVLYKKCLEYYGEEGDKNGVANVLNNIGGLYIRKKNYDTALDYCLKSMEISKQVGFPENIKNTASKLHIIYKATGNYKLSLENYKLYIKMNDSIINEDNRKATYTQQLKYEYDKKAATDSVAHVKEKFVQAAEIKKQEAELTMRKNRQYALFGGLGLVIVFAGFMYNRFKITQKQKAIIELQKTEVEAQKNIVDEKQKELLDSINYAERIQKAHLPTHAYIAKNLERLKA